MTSATWIILLVATTAGAIGVNVGLTLTCVLLIISLRNAQLDYDELL